MGYGPASSFAGPSLRRYPLAMPKIPGECVSDFPAGRDPAKAPSGGLSADVAQFIEQLAAPTPTSAGGSASAAAAAAPGVGLDRLRKKPERKANSAKDGLAGAKQAAEKLLFSHLVSPPGSFFVLGPVLPLFFCSCFASRGRFIGFQRHVSSMRPTPESESASASAPGCSRR